MPSRLCFVINPIAGRGRAARIWRRLAPFVADLAAGQGASYTVKFTEAPRHAEELAREAAGEGYDRVAAVGGDGTLNEVGNGLVGTDTALAIISAGTANDIVRTYPIPTDPEGAARLAFEGRAGRIDVGLVETAQVRRYFINMFGAGFDAEAAALVNELGPVVKRFGGAVAIPVCLVIALIRYRGPRVTLKVDDQVLDIPKIIFSAVAIGRYIGNGMMLLPDAIPDDGLFDIMWAHAMGRLEILRTVLKTPTGRHVEHPRVHVVRGKRVRLESATPLRCHLDGEAGGFLPATIELRPKALGIVLPRA
jgi:diacylglycerol kinase (ATP)